MRAARVGIAFSISNTGHGLPLAHLRNYTGFKERMLERPAVRKVIEREQSATWRERVTEVSRRTAAGMNGAIAMTIWTSDELDAIGAAEELKIATLRSDGTLRKPVTVWVVRHGPDLCVRSGYGNGAAWYRATQRRREGRIEAGGIAKDVSFADADAALHDAIDAAYRAKYGHHGARWVDPMVSSEARSTTIKLVPR